MVEHTESIRVINGYDEDAYTYYPVVVVGAGETGIAMGCRLKEVLGFDQFRIFDRQSGLGGTWWINRYPGVACDIPAVFYSFSFAPSYKWTPAGSDVVKYLHRVCQEYQITDKIQLNTDVSQMRWLEDEQEWELTLTYMANGAGDLSAKERQQRISSRGEEAVYLRKEIIRAKIVVSAVGGLVEPKGKPDIPGIDSFQGDLFHTARWPKHVDVEGKDVVVLGSGCSAAQVVPNLLKEPYNVKSVTQLMREPPWCVPRNQPPGGDEWWNTTGIKIAGIVPGFARSIRTFIFCVSEFSFFMIFKQSEMGAKWTRGFEQKQLHYMKKTTPEKYHDLLTPDYAIGCKRIIFDNGWYASMRNPKFSLSTQPLTSIQEKGVTLGPGRSYPKNSKLPSDEVHIPADTIILANGFDVSTWLHPLKVYGKEGKLLSDVWSERGGAQGYMGTAMDGFPNFFIGFGPNTATGHSSVILASENMVEYILRMIKPILDGDAKTIEIKREAEVKWTKNIQDGLKSTVWMTADCQSWYKNDDNWNATTYP